ncbi:hypothetical protein QYN14_10015 [Rhodococcus ruber]|uniref:hypothetical protein n=1 Tax=Rhodococcus ruber TaxID=1830 RepID=UPI002659C274|nr:hypothetical protein [Rhodococcus ruber]WKK13873.1 hypothetical protein QYN14_10015 [Rhodococcus ruber]
MTIDEPTTRPPEPSAHDRDRCTGWLGTDDAGRPRPCLTCRPRLRITLRFWEGWR